MAANQLGLSRTKEGFTLIEVMIALVFFTIASVTLLQGFELAWRRYSTAHERWKAAVSLWNQVEDLRSRPLDAKAGEKLQILPGTRPLYRRTIEISGSAGMLEWEVLRAEK